MAAGPSSATQRTGTVPSAYINIGGTSTPAVGTPCKLGSIRKHQPSRAPSPKPHVALWPTLLVAAAAVGAITVFSYTRFRGGGPGTESPLSTALMTVAAGVVTALYLREATAAWRDGREHKHATVGSDRPDDGGCKGSGFHAGCNIPVGKAKWDREGPKHVKEEGGSDEPDVDTKCVAFDLVSTLAKTVAALTQPAIPSELEVQCHLFMTDGGVVEVMLTMRPNKEQRDLLEERTFAVCDPQSPFYGKYLSMEEANAITAPSAANIASVVAWLEDSGRHKVEIITGGCSLRTKLSTGAALRLFGAAFHELVDQTTMEPRALRQQLACTVAVPTATTTHTPPTPSLGDSTNLLLIELAQGEALELPGDQQQVAVARQTGGKLIAMRQRLVGLLLACDQEGLQESLRALVSDTTNNCPDMLLPQAAGEDLIPICGVPFHHAVLTLPMDGHFRLDPAANDLLAVAAMLGRPAAVAAVATVVGHDYVVQSPAGWAAMNAVCRQGFLSGAVTAEEVGAVVHVLYRAGVNPLRYDDQGMSPFLYSCGHGLAEVVGMFLQHSGDPLRHADSRTGMTGFSLAVLYEHTEVVRVLIRKDVALSIARVRRDAVRLAAVNVGDFQGRTPLHHAATLNAIDCVQALLQHRYISVLLVDHRGRTALHDACANAHCAVALAIVRCIAESPRAGSLHALLNSQDKHAFTPRQLLPTDDPAREAECVQLLCDIARLEAAVSTSGSQPGSSEEVSPEALGMSPA